MKTLNFVLAVAMSTMSIAVFSGDVVAAPSRIMKLMRAQQPDMRYLVK